MTDEEERELRIELMNVQIDQGRLNIEKLRQDMERDRARDQIELRRWTRQFVLQIVGTIAASVAAGAALFGLILHLTGRL